MSDTGDGVASGEMAHHSGGLDYTAPAQLLHDNGRYSGSVAPLDSESIGLQDMPTTQPWNNDRSRSVSTERYEEDSNLVTSLSQRYPPPPPPPPIDGSENSYSGLTYPDDRSTHSSQAVNAPESSHTVNASGYSQGPNTPDSASANSYSGLTYPDDRSTHSSQAVNAPDSSHTVNAPGYSQGFNTGDNVSANSYSEPGHTSIYPGVVAVSADHSGRSPGSYHSPSPPRHDVPPPSYTAVVSGARSISVSPARDPISSSGLDDDLAPDAAGFVRDGSTLARDDHISGSVPREGSPDNAISGSVTRNDVDATTSAPQGTASAHDVSSSPAPVAASVSGARAISEARSVSTTASGNARRKTRRRTPTPQAPLGVSICMKYTLFAINMLFWFIGLALLAIGIWMYVETKALNNISQLTSNSFDVPGLFVGVGIVTGVISMLGCLGALRENVILLVLYAGIVAAFFLVQLIMSILAFTYQSWIVDQMRKVLQKSLKSYKDDIYSQDLFDWVQADWLECCGVDSIHDWDQNIYYNCSSPGREACGVPFSCCIKAPEDAFQNRLCGDFVRLPQYKYRVREWIHVKSCTDMGAKWISKNILPIAGVFIAMAVIQVFGICLALNLRADINGVMRRRKKKPAANESRA